MSVKELKYVVVKKKSINTPQLSINQNLSASHNGVANVKKASLSIAQFISVTGICLDQSDPAYNLLPI